MAISSSLIAKLKVQLKLAVNRLRMVQQKDIAIAKQQRREMAHLLEQSREASALIRTENIIRSDMITELHELLELYCELLLARAGLLEQVPCDPGLEEAVRSIIYAAPKTDIKELHASRALLCDKFGKDFALEAADGTGVSPRILDRLRVTPPAQELVRAYLTEIARTYGVAWPRPEPGADVGDDDDDDDEERGANDGAAEDGDGGGGGGGDEDGADGGAKEPPLLASPPAGAPDAAAAAAKKPPVTIAPASPSTENPSPRLKLPGQDGAGAGKAAGTPTKAPSSTARIPPAAPAGAPVKKAAATSSSSSSAATGSSDAKRVGGKIPDVDELARRFAELKR